MTLPGLNSPHYRFLPNSPAIVIGAGLAGCALARALVNAGFDCRLYDRQSTLASETSAVPCALYRPQVTRATQNSNRYFQQAFNRIKSEISTNISGDVNNLSFKSQSDGVLQLVKDHRLWPDSNTYSRLSQAEASQIAMTELAGDALFFHQAGWFDIKSLCQRWIRQSNALRMAFIGNTAIHSLVKSAGSWQLLDASKHIVDESPLVIVASAEVACRLSQTSHLPLQKSRGQISHFTTSPINTNGVPKVSVTGKGSVIPVNGGFWAGSTHHRQQHSLYPSSTDDQLNLRSALALCPQINRAIAHRENASKSWVGFRYSTPDRLPVVGAAPLQDRYLQDYADLRHGRQSQLYPRASFHQGLYLLTGFGSRGALHSVYAAEILTDIITGKMATADGNDRAISHMLHPGRFLIRQLRRGL